MRRNTLNTLTVLTAATATIVLAGGIALAEPSPAQTPMPSPAPSATPAKVFGPFVVTPERRPTAIHDSPRETYVISGADLARTGAVTVGDALRYLPGVVVRDYGTTGHLQTVLLRGASSTETLVLIDGRPANEPGVGLFDFSSFPAQLVDRVEVVEGAASALYGSAAMGGVINIITRGASASGGSAGATLGYEGAFSTNMSVSAVAEHDAGVRVDYDTRRARNAFSFPSFLGEPAGTIPNNDANGQDAALSLSNSDLAPIRVHAHFSDDTSDNGEPGSLVFGFSALARQQRDLLRGDVSFDRDFAHSGLSLQLYSDGQRIHFYDGTSDPSNFIFPYDDLAHFTTRGFALRDTIRGRANALTVGYDSRGDTAQFDSTTAGSGSASAPGSAATTGIYASDELKGAGPMAWTLGVRDERPQAFAHTVVPSIGVMYTEPGRDAGLRANYGRAFRVPALEETSPLFFGNPSLQPEYAATFDIGAFQGADSVTYFGTRASNLIVSEPPAFVPLNVSLADIRGFSVHVARLRPRGGLLQLDYTDYVHAANAVDGNRLPYRPTATGSVQISGGRDALTWGALMRYVGRRFADDPNVTLLPQYLSIGAYISRSVGPGSLTLRLENVTGERVEEVPGYPTLGPTMSLTFRTSWFD